MDTPILPQPFAHLINSHDKAYISSIRQAQRCFIPIRHISVLRAGTDPALDLIYLPQPEFLAAIREELWVSKERLESGAEKLRPFAHPRAGEEAGSETKSPAGARARRRRSRGCTLYVNVTRLPGTTFRTRDICQIV